MADAFRFFASWLRRPLLTGAVSPSSRGLARAMARQIDPKGEAPVLELGPGTGVVTAALIERGIAPKRIVAVEFNPDFCQLLSRRFPGVNVVEGDAYNLAQTIPERLGGPYGAVVSSLPLLTRPLTDRLKVIGDAFDRVISGGRYVQFSYGLAPPVDAMPGRWAVSQAAFVILNLPPARVWVYRRIFGK